MNYPYIDLIFCNHAAWLKGEDRGVLANLTKANLTGANLTKADLTKADLTGAFLTWADLTGANLTKANLTGANLTKADLTKADLTGANLTWADLTGANLTGADLTKADLTGANLTWADLTGARNLLNPISWIQKLEHDELGVIVYKRLGKTTFSAPQYWEISPGKFLEEIVNPLPTLDCACGVNFGTLEWCKRNYTKADLWRCRIRWIDLVSVVVPYNTDGKARCGRLELLEKIKEATDED